MQDFYRQENTGKKQGKTLSNNRWVGVLALMRVVTVAGCSIAYGLRNPKKT